MPDFTSPEDFLADESFQAFALEHDAAAGQYWLAWLAQHPAQAVAFREAEAVLHLLRTGQRTTTPAGLRQQEMARLWQAMRVPAAAPRLRTQRRQRTVVGAACALLLLLVAGLWWHYRPVAAAPPAYARYAAPMSEQRAVVLPDGSRVVLEAGAALTVARGWQPGHAREAWLRGSAYFDVAHLAAPEVKSVPTAPATVKFVVHTGPVDVAVLGTQFTVFSFGSRTKVVLSTGQIELSRTQGRAERVLLHPGQLAECDAATPGVPLATRPVHPRLYTAWTSGQLEFDDLPVSEIITSLQDTYGLRISVRDPRLLRQRLSGVLPTHDLDGLLAAFGKTLDVQVRRQGSQVWLD